MSKFVRQPAKPAPQPAPRPTQKFSDWAMI